MPIFGQVIGLDFESMATLFVSVGVDVGDYDDFDGVIVLVDIRLCQCR